MSLSTPDFVFIKDLVFKHAAITLDADKTSLVETRLSKVCLKESIATPTELVAKLRGKPFGPLHVKAVESMTTNETLFFRDMYPFDALRLHIVPELIQNKAQEKVINFWSAASSTGQEAYSLNMLLCENFPSLMNWKVTTKGTDFSEEVVNKAKSGLYTEFEINRGLPEALRKKYFEKKGELFKISDKICSRVDFHTMNLAGAWSFPQQFDVILLRNVLIYFDPPTKKEILTKMHRHLQPRGWLIMGTGEFPQNMDSQFERIVLEKATLFRKI